MLPNFFIIGAQKAATTWLAKRLAEHPDVFMAKIKEVQFYKRYFARGLGWYESHFSDWSGQTAIGEATPGYIYFPEVPGRIKATLGDDVRFIGSLRHPVDRAYSAFWMFLSRGHNIRADADFRTYYQRDEYGLRTRGNYFVQLSRYPKYFPRENLLVLIYEELKKDNQKALKDCYQFLGIDSQFMPDSLNARVNTRIDISMFHHEVWGVRRAMRLLPRSVERLLVSMGLHVFKYFPKRKRYEPLDEDLRQELLSDFMPDIKQLEDFLDRDLSIWYAPSRT